MFTENGLRPRHHVEVHVVVQGLRRERTARLRVRAEHVRSLRRRSGAARDVLIDDVAHADSVDGKQTRVHALVDERKREVAADLGEHFAATLDPGRDDGPAECVDRPAPRAPVMPRRVALDRNVNRARLVNRGGSRRAHRRRCRTGPRPRSGASRDCAMRNAAASRR